jgi:Flp pilus assembly protein TadG
MMPPDTHRERGAAAVEFALFVPILVFIAAASVFVVALVRDYHALTDISESGARYATRAGLDPENPGVYTFRRSSSQVVAYVTQLASNDGLTVETVTVTPNPATALPGTPVTVTVSARVGTGVLGSVARGIADAFPGFFGGSDFPSGGCAEDAFCLVSAATMREE